MNKHQSIPPEHEPEAGSSERPNPLHAQMQEAARQIKKTKNGMSVTAEDLLVKFSKEPEAGSSISPELLATVNEGIATFARLAAEVGRGFAGAIAAAEDFGAGMAEVNQIPEAGLDEEDE